MPKQKSQPPIIRRKRLPKPPAGSVGEWADAQLRKAAARQRRQARKMAAQVVASASQPLPSIPGIDILLPIAERELREKDRYVARTPVVRGQADNKSQPNLIFENIDKLFDEATITRHWKDRRTAFVNELTDLTVDHLALTSALDTINEKMPHLTGEAAALNVHELKRNMNGVFAAAYVRRVGRMLSMPEDDVRNMLMHLNERTWGPNKQPSIHINNDGHGGSVKRDNGDSKGSRNLAAADLAGVRKLGKRDAVPVPINPFGRML